MPASDLCPLRWSCQPRRIRPWPPRSEHFKKIWKTNHCRGMSCIQAMSRYPSVPARRPCPLRTCDIPLQTVRLPCLHPLWSPRRSVGTWRNASLLEVPFGFVFSSVLMTSTSLFSQRERCGCPAAHLLALRRNFIQPIDVISNPYYFSSGCHSTNLKVEQAPLFAPP